jgi:hypothetical protein
MRALTRKRVGDYTCEDSFCLPSAMVGKCLSTLAALGGDRMPTTFDTITSATLLGRLKNFNDGQAWRLEQRPIRGVAVQLDMAFCTVGSANYRVKKEIEEEARRLESLP